MTWRAIAAFRIVTADLERTARFYAQIGFTLGDIEPMPLDEMALLGLDGSGRRQRMRRGPSRVDLDCFDRPGRPYPAEADAESLLFQHMALVTDDIARSWALAKQAGAMPISREGPEALPQSAGGVTAIKFRDPDGHPLELLQFPDRTGGHPPPGTLGIDHTALSVADVRASQAFYEARGLTPSQGSVNRGPTQVALDDLTGVEVDVIPLRPHVPTPHLELLGYRHRGTRIVVPAAPNDIAATRIVWNAGQSGLARDPDGHLHQLQP